MEINDKQINDILGGLKNYLQRDFSCPIPTYGKNDGLDCIASGLNALAIQFQSYIAERNQIELQLENRILYARESEEKFQKAFQASASGITITRLSDSVYMDVNDAFSAMTGYSREELIGHTSMELGLVVTIERREEVLKEIREQGRAKDFELTVRKKSGCLLEILSSVETILLNGEKYAINSIYDITKRKRTEEQLAYVNKELESFTSSVSHDLRAPLRSISRYAQMLKEDYGSIDEKEVNRLIENIISNTSRMGTLIDDLLAFSKLDKTEITKAHVDMFKLVERVTFDIGKSMKSKARIQTGRLINVKADDSLLYQVMINLISNAIKYSSKKDNPIVEVFSEENASEIIFSVKDNGTGFDMQYADKLFGVFQRLHSQHEFEGTGVGLAIVQRVIAKHGGKVWANGKVNEGAIFSFSLPK